MAGASKGGRATGQASGGPTRRITAPVSETTFRRTGAYCKWRNLPLGDVVEAALLAYLRSKGFSLGELDASGPAENAA